LGDVCGFTAAVKPWSDYATAAGVPNLSEFYACVKKTNPIPRVEEGKELGKRLDARATPTLVVNGWKLGHPSSEEELGRMVKKILSGKSPVS
jgi:protein-disulfide isomerase